MTIRYAIDESFAVFGRFQTGRTVSCALFNGETGASIALSSTACTEIATSGVYRFNSSDITAPIAARTIVVWQMTDANSGLTDEGFVVVGDAEAGKLHEVWQDRGLDPAVPKVITEITEGEDYDEDVGAGIHKDVTKVGAVTTIDRT